MLGPRNAPAMLAHGYCYYDMCHNIWTSKFSCTINADVSELEFFYSKTSWCLLCLYKHIKINLFHKNYEMQIMQKIVSEGLEEDLMARLKSYCWISPSLVRTLVNLPLMQRYAG